MSRASERLYALLPAIHRTRDAAGGEPLRALMANLERELQAIEADVETTWDNWFIETCEEWLVPYIGEALGVRGLRDIAAADFSLRGYVADTLALRRRKGTAAATEQVARDVTVYPARAVELFAKTAITTHVNHVRGLRAYPAQLGTVHLRDPGPLEHIDGAFDPFAHTPDVRPIREGIVRHNLPNLGIFLFRLRIQEISESTARPISGETGWYRLDPRGLELGVFNLPRGEKTITALAEPEHIPHALTRLEFARMVSDPDPPIVVRTIADGAETTLDIEACHLGDFGGNVPSYRPDAGTAGVDPVLGRVVLNENDVPPNVAEPFEVLVDYQCASPGRLGAGPFDRAKSWSEQIGKESIQRQWGVSRSDSAISGEIVETLEEAVDGWNTYVGGLTADELRNAVGLIVLTDSRSYAAPTSIINVPGGARLYVLAAAWTESMVKDVPERIVGDVVPNRIRPHIEGDIVAVGSGATQSTRPGGVWFNGLMIEGAVRADPGDLERLDLAHCEIAGGIVVDGATENAGMSIRLKACASGAVESAGPILGFEAVDSVVQMDGFALGLDGCAVDLESSTVIGGIRCQTLSASNCILDEGILDRKDALDIAHRQQGCLRFSYVPHGSKSPRRFRCQPDLALENVADAAEIARVVARVRPSYGSDNVQDPDYGLLSRTAPDELRHTSSDGSEPGVWHQLQHAHRLANLRTALRQYLRFGLDAGAILDR